MATSRSLRGTASSLFLWASSSALSVGRESRHMHSTAHGDENGVTVPGSGTWVRLFLPSPFPPTLLAGCIPAALRCAVLCCAALRCAVLCCAVLAALCCAVLCCAVLCCACCAVLPD
jgi:hypothetical protein